MFRQACPVLRFVVTQSTLGKRYLSITTVPNKTVGFVGLGSMGLPMCINLSKHRDVIVYDNNIRVRQKAEDLGLRIVYSLDELASRASTIITVLPSDAEVDFVMTYVLSVLQKNSTVIDCTTVSPTTSRKWNLVLGIHGHLFVDAPVSGGVKGAENASLTFMVGGNEEVVKSGIQPVLESMGQRFIVCGGPGTGAAVKLCSNLALAAQMVGICEAMNLGEAFEVDPVVLASFMNSSTAKSWSCEVNNPHPMVAAISNSPAANDYEGGFAKRLI